MNRPPVLSLELRRLATDKGDEAAIASFARNRAKGEPADFDEAVHEAMEAVLNVIEGALQLRGQR